jgi:hypothetical protein
MYPEVDFKSSVFAYAVSVYPQKRLPVVGELEYVIP